MRNIYNLIWRSLLLSLFCMSNLANAAQLVASVDRDTLSVQETFTLTIAADSNAKGQPDTSTLKADFEILSSNVSQFTSISNAGSEFKKVWQLTLAPKRTGTLLIPSFNVDGAISDAIEINVSKQSSSQSSNNENVRVSVEVDKNSVNVQEQLLVKIKLISQVNLTQAEMQPLDIKDAVVIPLSEKPKQYIATINGREHLILEASYAVFPQTSGELTIPSVIWSVVPNVDRDLWNDPFGRNRSNMLRLPTDEKVIKVKPVPPAAAGKPWQPADKMELQETWSARLDNLKMGEPVTRTITISADGLTGGQIAPLITERIDGLTFYPDQPQNSDSKTDRGIKGTRIETMAIVPNRGGEFILPEVRVEWWDSKSESLKAATLPAKTMHVIGSVAPTTSQAIANAATTNTPSSAIKVESHTPLWLWIITACFVLLSLGLLIYALRLRKKIEALLETSDKTRKHASENEKHIWDILKHSAETRDAVSLRQAVLSWARLQWPGRSIHSLEDIAQLGNSAELSHALKNLDAVLYSNHSDETWDPSKLLKILDEYRKGKKMKPKEEGLKPLYSD